MAMRRLITALMLLSLAACSTLDHGVAEPPEPFDPSLLGTWQAEKAAAGNYVTLFASGPDQLGLRLVEGPKCEKVDIMHAQARRLGKTWFIDVKQGKTVAAVIAYEWDGSNRLHLYSLKWDLLSRAIQQGTLPGEIVGEDQWHLTASSEQLRDFIAAHPDILSPELSLTRADKIPCPDIVESLDPRR